MMADVKALELRIAALALAALASACSKPSKPAPAQSAATAPEVRIPPAEASAPSPVAPVPSTPKEKPSRLLSNDGVDDIVLGKPIPKQHLGDDARYEARWIADAQPIEGFLVGTPPVWATFDGPMKKVDPGPIEPLKVKLRPKALQAARAGAKVRAIVIEQTGVGTAAGIGVGSSYESLDQAHGPIDFQVNPEEFDSKRSCVAQPESLPRVRFLLESCDANAPRGAVKRIVLSWGED